MTINEWLSIDKTSGSGNDSVTLTALQNEVGERTIKLVVKGKYRTQSVNITQNFDPTIFDRKYFWIEFEEENGIVSFTKRYSFYNFDINISYSFDGYVWETMKNDSISMGNNKKVYIYNNTRYLGKKNDNLYGRRIELSQNCVIGGTALALSEMNYYGFLSCFNNNQYLIDASQLILPWDELKEGCFYSMFTNCQNLIGVPKLPATTLAKKCYYDMFSDCISLTKAPDLLATDLVDSCYSLMFAGCRNLSYIKMLGYNLIGNDIWGDPLTWASTLGGWVGEWSSEDIGNSGGTMSDGCGVASIGVFVKSTNADIPLNSSNGIPTGWSVYTSNDDYFWIKLEEDGDIQGLRNTFEFTYDKINWQSCPTTLSVPADTYVWFRNTSTILNTENTITTILFTQRGSVGGDLSSMGDMRDYNFYELFMNNIYLTDASKLILPWDVLANSCYRDMFYGCYSLETAPYLPATILVNSCYRGMFFYCTSLVNAPQLPATILADNCYTTMFVNCNLLTTAPSLPATILANSCYNSMFSDCTSLTTAPELLATTLTNGCYNSMFDGCSNLNYIKMLATDISASACLTSWVRNVAENGTFVKHPDMNDLPSGSNGIPSGWTIQEIS